MDAVAGAPYDDAGLAVSMGASVNLRVILNWRAIEASSAPKRRHPGDARRASSMARAGRLEHVPVPLHDNPTGP